MHVQLQDKRIIKLKRLPSGDGCLFLSFIFLPAFLALARATHATHDEVVPKHRRLGFVVAHSLKDLFDELLLMPSM